MDNIKISKKAKNGKINKKVKKNTIKKGVIDHKTNKEAAMTKNSKGVGNKKAESKSHLEKGVLINYVNPKRFTKN